MEGLAGICALLFDLSSFIFASQTTFADFICWAVRCQMLVDISDCVEKQILPRTRPFSCIPVLNRVIRGRSSSLGLLKR